MSTSIRIILDTRREKKTKKYPVKLRVSMDSKVELYPTIYDLSEIDYKKFAAPRISDDLQKVRSTLQQIETDAIKIAKDLDPFCFETFGKEFIVLNKFFRQRKIKKEPFVINSFEFDIKPYEKRFSILKEVNPSKDFISATFISYINRLLEEGRVSSALNYQDTYNSLKRFRGNVRFTDITVSYLNQYEHWMINVRNRSKTTVGIKLRALRAVFNEAIENGIIRKEKCYPFGRRKYQLPTSRNIKKALDLSDVQKIYEFEPARDQDKKAKAYWLFCYFGNGMNPKDMAHLKYKNIDGEYLHFIRAKTERTTRNAPKIVSAYINDDMKKIIEIWGRNDNSPNNFIFPIMDINANLMQQYDLVKSLVIFINKGMANIAKELNITKKITNIVTRHTFSTVLKRSGASTEFIQESLGHTDKKTTENYLDSFESVVKKEYSGMLKAFKKNFTEAKTT